MSAETQELAKSLHEQVAQEVGPQSYKVWFKNTTQFTCTDGFLKVGVPNLFIGGWIEDHFTEPLTRAVRRVLGRDVRITYAIDPVLFRNQRKHQLNSQAEFIEKQAERSIRQSRAQGDETPTAMRRLKGRLEDFVVGPTNRMAFGIAESVVEGSLASDGPVFFHSPCGLGKTHLLQGIANALAARRNGVEWRYLSGEEFTNQFLCALKTQKLDAFRHRYRNLDVLLIDDVQFIANKRATQEEFLHTFNALETARKRIVLASDAPPKMIGDLSESLVNRLVSGMVVRIERPDFETRCEILRRRAALTKHQVPEPVVRYIAERIQANIRELEGALLKLLAFASLSSTPLTLDVAHQALEEHLRQTGRILTVSDIERATATYFGLTPADLHSSRKSRTIALARNVAMYLARKHTDSSLPEIARVMGNKNHTTVLLACRRIANLLAQSASVTWRSAAGPLTRPLAALIQAQEEQLRGLPA